MGWLWMWFGFLVFDLLMIAFALYSQDYYRVCRYAVSTIATLLFLIGNSADRALGK